MLLSECWKDRNVKSSTESTDQITHQTTTEEPDHQAEDSSQSSQPENSDVILTVIVTRVVIIVVIIVCTVVLIYKLKPTVATPEPRTQQGTDTLEKVRIGEYYDTQTKGGFRLTRLTLEHPSKNLPQLFFVS